MKASTILLGILGFFIFGGAVTGCSIMDINNSLVSQEEAVTASWGQVQNVYQRRADLIPNLVNVVKGYATHEKETLEAVTKARNQAATIKLGDNATIEQIKAFQEAQNGLSQALSRLMVVAEAYPDLKANQGFLDLQKQLEGTENRIAVERRVFNEATQRYNSSVRSFPTSIVAGFKGMTTKAYFQADAEAAKVPQVKF